MIIEKKVIDFLRFTLCLDHVYAELPEISPDEFVLITVVDKLSSNQISRVTIEVYSYAGSKAGAIELDARVRSNMPLLAADNEVSSCRHSGGDDNPDIWLGKYRFRSVFNIVYYDD